MRAVLPVRDGHVDRDGVRVFFEVYGQGDPTVLLLMPDIIIESRAWKGQVPFLSRSFRVVVMDPRGNGRSDPSPTADQHTDRAILDDAWAVLSEVGAEEAVLAGVCSGAGLALQMAAEDPERVLGVCAINPGLRLTAPHPFRLSYDFNAVLDTDVGWAKQNRHYWQRDWLGFASFFFDEMLPEPHSTKQHEDCVGWAGGTTADAMLIEHDAPPSARYDPVTAAEICRAVRCPVLVVAGSEDHCQPPERGRIVAELTGGDLVVLEGSGHVPLARDPVKVNLLLRDFVRRCRRSGLAF
jgi:pimeloyl-ACP methyl ester carboxylesterase